MRNERELCRIWKAEVKSNSVYSWKFGVRSMAIVTDVLCPRVGVRQQPGPWNPTAPAGPPGAAAGPQLLCCCQIFLLHQLLSQECVELCGGGAGFSHRSPVSSKSEAGGNEKAVQVSVHPVCPSSSLKAPGCPFLSSLQVHASLPILGQASDTYINWLTSAHNCLRSNLCNKLQCIYYSHLLCSSLKLCLIHSPNTKSPFCNINTRLYSNLFARSLFWYRVGSKIK